MFSQRLQMHEWHKIKSVILQLMVIDVIKLEEPLRLGVFFY